MSTLPNSHNQLQSSKVAARLPAQDLARARKFYSEKLGLEPIEERVGGLRYQCGEGWFALYESSGKSSGTYTQMAFEVDNIQEAVRELCVKFESHDVPGLKTVNGIASVDGNYQSKGGIGELAAWFYDSEGNLLEIGQPIL